MADLTVFKGFESGWIVSDTGDRKPSQLLSGDCAALIEQFFGKRLRFNTLSKRPQLDGKELPDIFDYLHVVLSQNGWKISRGDARDALRLMAELNPFDPIDFELERVKNDPTIAPIEIDKFASLYLGNDDPLVNRMWSCFLIGAVARTKRRGCKLDTILVLRSTEHGRHKSDLFRALCFDEAYFCDTPISMKGSGIKDAYQKIGTNWIYEIAELESLTSKADSGALKALLSSRTDTYRAPFGENTKKYPRPSVFVASANESVLLRDQTGSRRFHIIEITEKIKIELVTLDRDNIWKAAVLAYEAGQNWWLDDQQEEQAQKLNEAYQAENIYQGKIRAWLNRYNRDYFETWEVFESFKENPNKWDIEEAGKALKNLGYIKKQKRVGKKKPWLWRKVSSDLKVRDESVTPQNPAGVKGFPRVSYVTSEIKKEEKNINRTSPTPRCETDIPFDAPEYRHREKAKKYWDDLLSRSTQ